MASVSEMLALAQFEQQKSPAFAIAQGLQQGIAIKRAREQENRIFDRQIALEAAKQGVVINSEFGKINQIAEGVKKGQEATQIKRQLDIENKQLDQKLKQRNLQLIDKVLGGGDADVPIGTTASVGGLTVPLNRPLTDDSKKVVATAQTLSSSIDTVINMVDKQGIGDSFLDQVIADSGNAIFATGDLETLQSELKNIRSIIPFAKGGKQLTPFEAKLLFGLVNLKGKTVKTIKRDLTRLKDEFNTLSDLSTKGVAGFNQKTISNMSNEDIIRRINQLKGQQ